MGRTSSCSRKFDQLYWSLNQLTLFNEVEYVWSTPDAEELIVRMARVSNPNNENNMETAPRLIKYLIKHKHWSPFEMANLCLKISTERDISAQICRHRSFTFQEYSSRYAEMPEPRTPSFRRQDIHNRQNSIDDLDEFILDDVNDQVASCIDNTWKLYKELLEFGIAKETARRILPLCSPTTIYMNGTLRSWIHYIDLRSSNDTQKEHRNIALACQQIFTDRFPLIAKALQ